MLDSLSQINRKFKFLRASRVPLEKIIDILKHEATPIIWEQFKSSKEDIKAAYLDCYEKKLSTQIKVSRGLKEKSNRIPNFETVIIAPKIHDKVPVYDFDTTLPNNKKVKRKGKIDTSPTSSKYNPSGYTGSPKIVSIPMGGKNK